MINRDWLLRPALVLEIASLLPQSNANHPTLPFAVNRLTDISKIRRHEPGCDPERTAISPKHQIDAALARDWARLLKGYARPSTGRSLFELTVTLVPLVVIWVLMVFSLDYGYWIALILSLPAAGLLVRLFMIQHDCGHYAFFRSRRANDLLGSLIGVLTLTPHGYWREAHAIHHATSGDLDRIGIGEVILMTVQDYEELPRWRRLAYRLYRHPLVFFGLGPVYVFVLKFRLPLDMLCRRWRLLPGVMVTNLAIGGVVALIGFVVGYAEFAMVQVPITMIAASIGVWLFFVQHQFEGTYWARSDEWDFHSAAVAGSSYYDLPRVMRWFTANIGVHHVHHLCSRIPNYRLQACLKRVPELRLINRLTLRQSVACVPLTLWDEQRQRLVSFRTLARNRAAAKRASEKESG